MYSLIELSTLCKSGYICCFEVNNSFVNESDKVVNTIFDITETDVFRIFASDCTDVKVVYNSLYGFYENIVVTKDGTKISIVL